MNKIKLLTICALIGLTYSCKTIKIQEKKLKAEDICGECKPGNQGPYMLMKKKTFEPQLEDNSTPKSIAYNILGHVFPADNLTGTIKIPCSKNTVKSPFTIDKIKLLGSTGASGTSIDYSEKETLQIDVSATVESDLESIKAANPSISVANLDEFKAKLSAAYSKFANKELTIGGKYFQYGLDVNTVIKVAKNIEYSDCRDYIFDTEREKRMITAIGLVYFDVKSSSNSVDKIASELKADAAAYGITFNVSAEFKRNISRELKKVTKGYFQIVVWRTVGTSDLDILR
jgi:hypothetical protein